MSKRYFNWNYSRLSPWEYSWKLKKTVLVSCCITKQSFKRVSSFLGSRFGAEDIDVSTEGILKRNFQKGYYAHHPHHLHFFTFRTPHKRDWTQKYLMRLKLNDIPSIPWGVWKLLVRLVILIILPVVAKIAPTTCMTQWTTFLSR